MTVLCLPSDNFFAKRTERTEQKNKTSTGKKYLILALKANSKNVKA